MQFKIGLYKAHVKTDNDSKLPFRCLNTGADALIVDEFYKVILSYEFRATFKNADFFFPIGILGKPREFRVYVRLYIYIYIFIYFTAKKQPILIYYKQVNDQEILGKRVKLTKANMYQYSATARTTTPKSTINATTIKSTVIDNGDNDISDETSYTNSGFRQRKTKGKTKQSTPVKIDISTLDSSDNDDDSTAVKSEKENDTIYPNIMYEICKNDKLSNLVIGDTYRLR
jgi:hypothetical protein